jgi:hypothetical protein
MPIGSPASPDERETFVYRLDPGAWAVYLNSPYLTDPDWTDVVPAATPTVDGLPLWVVDELFEVAGSQGPVVALVDGRLVGLASPDD